MGSDESKGQDPRHTCDRANDRACGLTTRQREVVQLAANGRTAGQSACALGLSVRTVQDHLEEARGRAGVASTTELVAWAISTGIVSYRQMVVPAPRHDSGREVREFPAGTKTAMCKNLNIPAHDPQDQPANDGAERRGSDDSRHRSADGQSLHRRGRPTVMTAGRLALARELLGSHTITDIAMKLGVSRRTLYVHMRQIRPDVADSSRA